MALGAAGGDVMNGSRGHLGIQPSFGHLGKSLLIIGDPRRFSLASPVMDIEEHKLTQEKLTPRAPGGVEECFDPRAARRVPGVLETVADLVDSPELRVGHAFRTGRSLTTVSHGGDSESAIIMKQLRGPTAYG
jgi:hypothetical protein